MFKVNTTMDYYSSKVADKPQCIKVGESIKHYKRKLCDLCGLCVYKKVDILPT